jgi:hypothetical protein
MTLEEKYGVRMCKCGEKLKPHKVWFKNLILYTCPKSNIFYKKNHSTSRAFFVNAETLKMGTVINNLK